MAEAAGARLVEAAGEHICGEGGHDDMGKPGLIFVARGDFEGVVLFYAFGD